VHASVTEIFTWGVQFDVSAPSRLQSTVRRMYGETRTSNLESIRFTIGAAMAVVSLCDGDDPYEMIAERVTVRDGVVLG
jgi:hypothetical protein